MLEELGKVHNIAMGDYCTPRISDQVDESEDTPATQDQEKENKSSKNESGSTGGSDESEDIGRTSGSKGEEEVQG